MKRLVLAWLLGMAASSAPALPAAPDAVGPGLFRKLETRNLATYALTLRGGSRGSIRVTDPRPPFRVVELNRPGSTVIIAKADESGKSIATWQLEFRPDPAAEVCRLDLELTDPAGRLRVPFRVTVRPGDPRITVTMAPGAYDARNAFGDRGYWVKGPVTLVEETGDQDVLAWIGP